MNRSDLVRAIADQGGFSLIESEEILDLIIETIGVSLACGEPVLISRFGKFEPRLKKAGVRRNPRTGEDVQVPEKTTVLFRAAPFLKQRINKTP